MTQRLVNHLTSRKSTLTIYVSRFDLTSPIVWNTKLNRNKRTKSFSISAFLQIEIVSTNTADSNNRQRTRWQQNNCSYIWAGKADQFRYFCTHSAAVLSGFPCQKTSFLFITWPPSEKGLFAILISYRFQVSKELKYCLLKK